MFINQHTMEQRQERDLIDDHPPNSSVAVWNNPFCAWCLSEHGLELGNGSHGICTQHADSLLQQHRERSARRHHPH